MNRRKQEIEFNEEIANAFMNPKISASGLHDFLDIKIVEAGPGTMRGQLVVRDELLTPIGNMHGGVLSAFADHMLGSVCYPAMQPGWWAATTEFKINLTAPVTKGLVDAYAEIINMSRTQAVVQIEIQNEDRLVAAAQGTVTLRSPR